MLARLLVVVALCYAIGMQWAVGQSIAWASMLIENSKTFSLTEAVAKTFDGAHPCNLCHAVQKGQSQEKKSGARVVRARVDLICSVRTFAVLVPFEEIRYASGAVVVSAHVYAPAVPPPRAALG